MARCRPPAWWTKLFLTIAPKLSGGGAPPRILEGELDEVDPLRPAPGCSRKTGELFARYSRR